MLASSRIPWRRTSGYLGLEYASGYEPVPVKTSMQADRLVRDSLLRKGANLNAMLSLEDSPMVLLPLGFAYQSDNLDRKRFKGATLLSSRDSMRRTWIVRRTMRVDGLSRSLAAVS